MPQRRKTKRKKRLQRVSVKAELRDAPDWDKYAWALLQYARILSTNKPASSKHPKTKS